MAGTEEQALGEPERRWKAGKQMLNSNNPTSPENQSLSALCCSDPKPNQWPQSSESIIRSNLHASFINHEHGGVKV